MMREGAVRGRAASNRSAQDIRGLLISIALLALATNLLYFGHFKDYYFADSRTYITAASNLIQGRGFTDALGYPQTLVTPGYPLLIAPFLRAGLDLKYLIILQHLLLVLLVVGSSAATFQLFKSRRQTLLVGLLLSIDLPLLEAANAVLTDIFFASVFGIALWLLWAASSKPRQISIERLLISGVVAGAAVLIRPVGLYFFAPAAAYLLLACGRRRFRAALAFTIAFGCFPLAWAVRNYHETGLFAVASIAGQELICCRAPGVLALDDPGDFNSNIAKRKAQLEETACANLKSRYGKDCSELSSAQKSGEFLRVGGAVLWEHPFGYLRLALRGAAVLLLDGGPSSLQGLTGIDPQIGVRLLLTYTIPVLCSALFGLYRVWRDDRRLFYLSLFTTAYFVALSSGGESYSRYRVPIIPLYLFLAAVGADAFLKSVRPRFAGRPDAKPARPDS
jgi:hypothetical protein